MVRSAWADGICRKFAPHSAWFAGPAILEFVEQSPCARLPPRGAEVDRPLAPFPARKANPRDDPSLRPLASPLSGDAVEDVQIAGHIIDSLILPKVLDLITASGGSFRIKEFTIGQARSDPSFALVEVRAKSADQLTEILGQIGAHGAVPVSQQDCQLVAADIAGAFPEGFYSTTNQRTEIRLGSRWIEVADQEMDFAVAVDETVRTVRCVPMSEVELGTLFVVGHAGVRRLSPRAVARPPDVRIHE